MDCKQVNELLVDYLYDELDRAQAASLEEHLHACPQCAGEVGSFRRTREVMGELEDLEPSPAVGQRLLAEATRTAPAKSSFSERLRAMLRVFVMHPALAAAATLVAVLGVSFYAYRQGLPPARTERRSDLPLAGETATIRPTGETVPAPAASPATPAADRTAIAAGEVPAANEEGEQKQKAPQEAQQARASGVLVAKDEEAYRDNQLGNLGTAASRAGPAATRGHALRGRKELAKKSMVPPVQAPARPGATYDDLKLQAQAAQPNPAPVDKVLDDRDRSEREDAPAKRASKSDGYAQGRTVALRRPTTSTRTPAPPPAPSPRRARARRQANVTDVGGGSSGVWANQSRKGLGDAAGDVVAQQGAGKAGADQAQSQAVQRQLATGDAAARAGRCLEALRAYDDVLAMRPGLVERVASSLGRCAKALKGNGRYLAIAARAQAQREARASAYTEIRAKASKRRAARPAKAKPAAKRASQQKKNAAPTAVDAYH